MNDNTKDPDKDNVLPLFGSRKGKEQIKGPTTSVEQTRKLPVATYAFQLQGQDGDTYEVVRDGHLIASASALILLDEDGDVAFGLPFGQNVILFDRLDDIEVDLEEEPEIAPETDPKL